jgi:hypothetical protein
MHLILSLGGWLESSPQTFVDRNNDKLLTLQPKDPDSQVVLTVLPATEAAMLALIKTGILSKALPISNVGESGILKGSSTGPPKISYGDERRVSNFHKPREELGETEQSGVQALKDTTFN